MSAKYGDTVIINCRATTQVIPTWIIGYPNGSITNITILPAYVTIIPEGLVVSVTNLRYNLTNYTCLIYHYVPNLRSGQLEHVPIRSHTGILTINLPLVSFCLVLQYNAEINSVSVRKGGTIDLKIMKKEGDDFTYNVTLHSTSGVII